MKGKTGIPKDHLLMKSNEIVKGRIESHDQRSAFQQASWSRYHGGIICIIRVEVSEFRSFYCNIRFWRFFYVSLEKRGVSYAFALRKLLFI